MRVQCGGGYHIRPQGSSLSHRSSPPPPSAACSVVSRQELEKLVKVGARDTLAFEFFCAVALARIDTAWVAPAAVFAALVTFSRFILKRHTVIELILGTALGLEVGSVLVFALGIIANGLACTLPAVQVSGYNERLLAWNAPIHAVAA